MANDTNEFYYELKTHLESFRQQEPLPKVPVTTTGIPREGLTVKYHHLSAGSAQPAEMASEAAKVIGVAGVGTAGGAAVGAVIGKVVLGGTLARIGVASAGAAIGIPILAPVALVGGAISTAAYAAYKVGKGKREQENAEDLLKRLMEHMQGFSPSVDWPEIEMYVSAPDAGLAAIWQPGLEGGYRKTAEATAEKVAPGPWRVRLWLVLRNLLIKIRHGSRCCGHLGQPAC